MTWRPPPPCPSQKRRWPSWAGLLPKGNIYVDLRAEFGTLYDDQLLADLYPPFGRPVEVAPWRMALVVVMSCVEGLTDRRRRTQSAAVSIGNMP